LHLWWPPEHQNFEFASQQEAVAVVPDSNSAAVRVTARAVGTWLVVPDSNSAAVRVTARAVGTWLVVPDSNSAALRVTARAVGTCLVVPDSNSTALRVTARAVGTWLVVPDSNRVGASKQAIAVLMQQTFCRTVGEACLNITDMDMDSEPTVS
jgi:hypothetical protein